MCGRRCTGIAHLGVTRVTPLLKSKVCGCVYRGVCARGMRVCIVVCACILVCVWTMGVCVCILVGVYHRVCMYHGVCVCVRVWLWCACVCARIHAEEQGVWSAT